jgi:hypothetical protein
MNERFAKLLQECIVPADSAEDYSKSKGLVIPDEKLDVAKFAELIVRDCATKANATALDLRIRPELDARKYVGDCILKCFGVEA